MDESTEDVTLLAGFIFDVLAYYRAGWMENVAKPLFEMTAHLDPDKPLELVPIQLYNDVCNWIEKRLGQASIRNAGKDIGSRAYDAIVESGIVGSKPTPSKTFHGLVTVARQVIQDPKGRGWEIMNETPSSVRLRRTQTFNCMLQEGSSRCSRSAGGLVPSVVHDKCTRRGDEYCEYVVGWRN